MNDGRSALVLDVDPVRAAERQDARNNRARELSIEAAHIQCERGVFGVLRRALRTLALTNPLTLR
jgi:hypothetical protein